MTIAIYMKHVVDRLRFDAVGLASLLSTLIVGYLPYDASRRRRLATSRRDCGGFRNHRESPMNRSLHHGLSLLMVETTVSLGPPPMLLQRPAFWLRRTSMAPAAWPTLHQRSDNNQRQMIEDRVASDICLWFRFLGPNMELVLEDTPIPALTRRERGCAVHEKEVDGR
ncbi:hypothetical protein P171DRAFT_477960 [Karstenula rhodostoma CBS 690.94]|uniref:Uncharacterized protein n=1 Tax=Karstenula rhodostoma CBS 690.94 TaxID=1392251 RepID=A0A9P4U522_9PLEO|nr:hypothetical protein P171DRAFT_477960 [Karstenula rhodostoma CBS 690.94]